MLDYVLRLVWLCFQILVRGLGTGIEFRVERNSGCFYFAFLSELGGRMSLDNFIVDWMCWFYKLTEIDRRETINLIGFIKLVNPRCVVWLFDLFSLSYRNCRWSWIIKTSCVVLLEVERLLRLEIISRIMTIPICNKILRQTRVILKWVIIVGWLEHVLILLQAGCLERTDCLIFGKWIYNRD